MTEKTAGAPTAGAEPPRTRRSRRVALLSAGVVVVLAATAAIVVPQIVHAQRVSTYAELVDQRDGALVEQAEAKSMLDAAVALSLAQHAEMSTLAQRMLTLGQTPEPILAAGQAQQLTAAGETMTSQIGAAVDDASAAAAHERLVAAVQELQTQDAEARTAAHDSGEEAPVAAAPASYLSLDIAGASDIIGAERVVEHADTVADDDVTEEIIEETRSHLASIADQTEQLMSSIRANEKRMVEFDDALEDAALALRSVADGAEAQAGHVLEQASKAPDAAGAAVAAAQQARAAAADEEADPAGILDGLAAYVAAAQSAQSEHAAVVQREREEAEARSRAKANRPQNRGGSSGNRLKLCVRYSNGSLGFTYC